MMHKLGWCLLGLFLSACGPKELQTVDVFFTADVQGFYFSRPEPRLENQEAGGYGVLKNFLAKQTGDFLLFDGGNWLGGVEGSLTKGAYIPALVPGLPFTAGTLTDKDLIYGWPHARGLVKELNYPLVVSNLRLDNQIPWPLHDYQIRTVRGIKFGIFGLMNPWQKAQARLPGLTVLPPLETAQEMSALLKEKGVDVIVVLSSLPMADERGTTNATLAAEVEGIDLILSSNQDNDSPETEQVKRTRIVYPGAKLDSVARITLAFDEHKQLVSTSFTDEPLLKEKYGEDETLAARAEEFLQQARSQMKKTLTHTEQAVPTQLHSQSALGGLLTQCLHKWAKLDGAVLNADSIRNSLPAGTVTEFDLYKTYPYGDNITFVTMKGEAFTKALQASLNGEDNFPQIAGFNVQYMQSSAGKRITRVTLDNGRIVRPQETYRFAVTDHILAGGFGHDEFINALEFKSTFVEARQIMRACLARQKTLEVPSTQGRWRQVP